MTTSADKATLAIREQAAEWTVRLGSTDLEATEKTEFAVWLRRSPLHVKEYLRAEAAWQAMEGVAATDDTDVKGLLKIAMPNVVSFPQEQLLSSGNSRKITGENKKSVQSVPILRSRRYSLVRYIAVAAALVMIVLTFAIGPQLIERLNPNVYTTGTGEQRRIVLSDGSVVELNTRSKVRVSLDGKTRDIHLIAGEAFFDVAKDAARPFRVHGKTAVVQALGTQFNVYQQEQRTVVTVLEGLIAVEQNDAAAGFGAQSASLLAKSPVREVSAGGAVQISEHSAIRVAAQDPAHAVAWRQRRLIFDSEPLAAVIDEFNRYNAQTLVVEDAALRAERISGVFDADKPLALIRFLEQGGDVRIEELSGSRLLLARPN